MQKPERRRRGGAIGYAPRRSLRITGGREAGGNPVLAPDNQVAAKAATNCGLFFAIADSESNFSITSFLQIPFQPENLLGRGLLSNARRFYGIRPPANTIYPGQHAANNIVPGKFVAIHEAS